VAFKVASNLADYLLHDLVLANDFGAFGARRLDADLRLGFIPLLLRYNDAHRGLVRLNEAADLLLAAKGVAALTLSALEEAGDRVNEANDVLKERGVQALSGVKARAVLRRRVDLKHILE